MKTITHVITPEEIETETEHWRFKRKLHTGCFETSYSNLLSLKNVKEIDLA